MIVNAYHTETPSQYRYLMEKLEKRNCKWWGGKEKPTKKFNWHKFKENTCIMLDRNNILTYCDIQFVNECIEAECECDQSKVEVSIKTVNLPRKKTKWKWSHLR